MPSWGGLAPLWQGLNDTWAAVQAPFRYDPNPRCFIGGVEVTDLLDSDVVVRRGRDTVYQPTNASYTSFEFTDLDGVPLTVGNAVTVSIDDFQGVPQTIFTGTVSDFERRMVRFSPTEPRVNVRIQAVGPLAELNRRVVLFGGRASENDGERVLAALTAAVPNIVDGDLVDDGLFELTALPEDTAGYDPLAVIQQAAFSGQGILFETPDGRIGYANADRRFANLRNDVIDIPLKVTAVDRFAVSSQLADLTNEVVVAFGDDESVTVADAESIDDFGLLDQRLSTVLLNESNAEAFAEEFLRRHSFPRKQLQEIGIGLEILDIDLFDRILNLGTCGCTDAVRVRGIPARLGLTRFEGFVEGLEYRLSRSTGELRLLVSDAELSIGAVRFSGVDSVLTWDDVDPALQWRDAIDVTAG